MAATNEGLRERKKRATRETIAATARELFAQQGFDEVTVAEVAAAADVSEKTVFNHFAAKEDLAFAGGEGPVARLLEDLARRPAGTPVIDVFRDTTATMIRDLTATGQAEEILEVTRIVQGSRVLGERLLAKWEREFASLAAVIAETSGAREGDVAPEIAARTLWWTHRAIFRTAIEGLMAGEDRKRLARRLRAEATRAYGLVAEGLGDYGAA
jgi:AcrR family transcriptional regulator